MMTLTELLPTIKQLSHLDKIKLIRLLAEEMESREKIAPLECHKLTDDRDRVPNGEEI